MKKFITILLYVAAAVALWSMSFSAGVQHAIRDSEIWTVDCYNPEDPDASAWGEYDQLIYIELDGDIYAHGMYQG